MRACKYGIYISARYTYQWIGFLADLFYLELGAPFNNQHSGTAGATLLPSKIYHWP